MKTPLLRCLRIERVQDGVEVGLDCDELAACQDIQTGCRHATGNVWVVEGVAAEIRRIKRHAWSAMTVKERMSGALLQSDDCLFVGPRVVQVVGGVANFVHLVHAPPKQRLLGDIHEFELIMCKAEPVLEEVAAAHQPNLLAVHEELEAVVGIRHGNLVRVLLVVVGYVQPCRNLLQWVR